MCFRAAPVGPSSPLGREGSPLAGALFSSLGVDSGLTRPVVWLPQQRVADPLARLPERNELGMNGWKRFAREWQGDDPHYVLCRPDKTPATEIWKNISPSPETHGGPVGIVPWSIGCAVVDVDGGEGERDRVVRMLGRPAVEMRSTNGGWHLWYWQTTRFTKAKFGGGDLICAGGYVVVTLPERLLGLYDFEGRSLDVRRARESAAPPEAAVAAEANGSVSPFAFSIREARRTATEAPALQWEFGSSMLFEDPDYWTRDGGAMAVTTRLVNVNERLGKPMDASQLRVLAEEAGCTMSPASLMVLALAGGDQDIGQTSRAAGTLERDLEIASMRDDGYTWSEIGVEFEIDPSTAQRACQRVSGV